MKQRGFIESHKDRLTSNKAHHKHKQDTNNQKLKITTAYNIYIMPYNT